MDEYYHPVIHALDLLYEGEPRTLKQLLLEGADSEALSRLCDFSLVKELLIEGILEATYQITNFGKNYYDMIFALNN